MDLSKLYKIYQHRAYKYSYIQYLNLTGMKCCWQLPVNLRLNWRLDQNYSNYYTPRMAYLEQKPSNREV